jgi:hypothetical protein
MCITMPAAEEPKAHRNQESPSPGRTTSAVFSGLRDIVRWAFHHINEHICSAFDEPSRFIPTVTQALP